MELTLGALDLVFAGGVEGAGESVLGVVGDRQGVVETLRLDDGQHRAADLSLREAGHGSEIGDHRGLDEIAVARGAPATRNETPFALTELDVVEDRLHGALVD